MQVFSVEIHGDLTAPQYCGNTMNLLFFEVRRNFVQSRSVVLTAYLLLITEAIGIAWAFISSGLRKRLQQQFNSDSAACDSAAVFTCLRIALRMRPENGLTKLQ